MKNGCHGVQAGVIIIITFLLVRDYLQEELRMTAAALLNDLAESLGNDLCKQFVTPEMESLSEVHDITPNRWKAGIISGDMNLSSPPFLHEGGKFFFLSFFCSGNIFRSIFVTSHQHCARKCWNAASVTPWMLNALCYRIRCFASVKRLP